MTYQRGKVHDVGAHGLELLLTQQLLLESHYFYSISVTNENSSEKVNESFIQI